MTQNQIRRCIICGCTDDAACPGGCAWVPGFVGDQSRCTACPDAKPSNLVLLRFAVLGVADRMEKRADDGDNPSDCTAMGEFADELRAAVADSKTPDPDSTAEEPAGV